MTPWPTCKHGDDPTTCEDCTALVNAMMRADRAEAERDRLRAVVRKLVWAGGLALEDDKWLSYACEEYTGLHDLTPDEIAAYRTALDGSEVMGDGR